MELKKHTHKTSLADILWLIKSVLFITHLSPTRGALHEGASYPRQNKEPVRAAEARGALQRQRHGADRRLSLLEISMHGRGPQPRKGAGMLMREELGFRPGRAPLPAAGASGWAVPWRSFAPDLLTPDTALTRLAGGGLAPRLPRPSMPT